MVSWPWQGAVQADRGWGHPTVRSCEWTGTTVDQPVHFGVLRPAGDPARLSATYPVSVKLTMVSKIYHRVQEIRHGCTENKKG